MTWTPKGSRMNCWSMRSSPSRQKNIAGWQSSIGPPSIIPPWSKLHLRIGVDSPACTACPVRFKRVPPMRYVSPVMAALLLGLPARADESFDKVCREVNPKLCKLYGSGGYKGVASYATGIVVSPDGYILTVASQMLDTPDLRVHLYDGRRFHGKV